MTDVLALIVWLVLLALAVPYVRRAKHPRAKTFPAAMLFVLLRFLVSAALFCGFSRLLVAIGRNAALDSAGWASVILGRVFTPAFPRADDRASAKGQAGAEVSLGPA